MQTTTFICFATLIVLISRAQGIAASSNTSCEAKKSVEKMIEKLLGMIIKHFPEAIDDEDRRHCDYNCLNSISYCPHETVWKQKCGGWDKFGCQPEGCRSTNLCQDSYCDCEVFGRHGINCCPKKCWSCCQECPKCPKCPDCPDCPTPEPTPSPTEAPTCPPIPISLPTSLPSSKPSCIPTDTPTTIPTSSFTIRVAAPTSEPTGYPTTEPTSHPTGSPSIVASKAFRNDKKTFSGYSSVNI